MTGNEKEFIYIFREAKSSEDAFCLILDIMTRFAAGERSENIATSYGITKTATGFMVE